MSISKSPLKSPNSKLSRSFYLRNALEVAQDLIGRIVVHRVRGREIRSRIVETEAYVGSHDLACHASKGRTNRTEVMFGQGGHAYVYFIYGMYDMFNIVTSLEGDAQAVLIRAAEPMESLIKKDLSGPGKFAREMRITRRENGIDLTGERLFLTEGNPPQNVHTSKRIGVEYAKEWKDALLRFYDPESRSVSRMPKAPTNRRS